MAEESMLNITADVERILDNNPDAAGTHSALVYLAAAAEQLVKDLGDMQMRLSQLEARAETRQASGHNPQSGNDAEKLDLDQLQQDAEVLQNDLSIYGFTGANYPAVKRLIKAAPGLIAMARSWKDKATHHAAAHDIQTALLHVQNASVGVGTLRIVGKSWRCSVFEVDGKDRPNLVGFTLSWRINEAFMLRTEERLEERQKGEGQ